LLLTPLPQPPLFGNKAHTEIQSLKKMPNSGELVT
jgi:hypothetical protein